MLQYSCNICNLHPHQLHISQEEFYNLPINQHMKVHQLMESYHLGKQYNKVLQSLNQPRILNNLQKRMNIQRISLQMDSNQQHIPYIKGRKVCIQNDQSSNSQSSEDNSFHLDSHTNLQDTQDNDVRLSIVYTMKCCLHIVHMIEE